MVQSDAYRVAAIPSWHENLHYQETSSHSAKAYVFQTIGEFRLLRRLYKPLPVNRAWMGLVHKEKSDEIKRERGGKSPPINP